MTMKNAFVLFLVAILFPTCLVFAGPVPDTGQTQCFDNDSEIPCPQKGEPFFGQDANYTINPPSYTKLDASGNSLPLDATEWVMVRDNVTGLIWEVKNQKDEVQDYTNPHDADNTYTWYDSNPVTNGGDAGTPGDETDTEDFINALNAAGYGGYSQWRLPTIEESHTIIDYGMYSPAIDTAYFPNTNSYAYWSSTTSATQPDIACISGSVSGGVECIESLKSDGFYVRAVRGGQSEPMNDSLVDNGDGTITDPVTGLIWQKEDDGTTRTWEAAITYCEGLSLSGYDDWRMPNVRELNSIVDFSRYHPAIDPVFSNTKTSRYWSSTTLLGNPAWAWYVNFDDGTTLPFYNYKSDSYYVRAVRAGIAPRPKFMPWLPLILDD